MTTTETGTHTPHEGVERLLTAVTPALAALKAAQIGLEIDGDATVYLRMYQQGSLVCALTDNGAFSFARGADTVDPSELLVFSPQETLALLAFWRDIAQGEIFTLIEARRAAEGKLVQLLDERRAARRQARTIGLSSTTDLDPDILTTPPRVVTAPDGTPMLQLHGSDGWSDQGPVTDVARLDSFGLALVGTPETVYLMHAADVPM